MPRAAALLLTLAAVGAIALATLRTADPLAPPSPFLTCLVCGQTGGLDVLLNTLLFAPLGAGLALLGRRALVAALAGLALSLFVETMQLLVFRGRDPSLSDLLTNTTGTALGWLVARHWRRWLLPAPAAARRLAAAGLAAWAAVLAFTLWGFAPDAADGPYVLHEAPPASEVARAFEGEILARALNDRTAPGPSADPALAAELRAPVLRLEAAVRPSYPPGMFRPVASAYTWDWRDVAVLGQRERNAVLRLRTRSARLRLPLPALVLRGAVPDPAAGDAGVVRLAGGRTPRALWVRAEAGGRRREIALPRSPLAGWALVGTTLVPYGARGPLVTLLWAAAWLLPLGWWERRGWAGAPRRLAPAALALLSAATLASDGSAPTAAGWLVVALAPPAGWLLADAAVRARRALAAGRDAGDTSPP